MKVNFNPKFIKGYLCRDEDGYLEFFSVNKGETLKKLDKKIKYINGEWITKKNENFDHWLLFKTKDLIDSYDIPIDKLPKPGKKIVIDLAFLK